MCCYNRWHKKGFVIIDGYVVIIDDIKMYVFL